MKEFLIYMAKSGIFLFVFGTVYFLFLRRQTFFRFNRLYLLLGLLISFVLPTVQFSYDVIIPYQNASEQALVTSIVDTQISPSMEEVRSIEESNVIGIWHILLVIYLLGVLLLLVRNILVFRNLKKYKKLGKMQRVEGCRLVDSPNVQHPFSILNQVFMDSSRLADKEKEIILKHEISHIKQKHWIDLICSECALLLQWFNPIMWYYIYLQKENHEYLADEAVLRNGESIAVYRAVLINQRFQGPIFSFANSFNYLNHKNRLDMMKKTKTQPWKKIAVLMVLPLFGAFYTLSAKPNYVNDDNIKTIENKNPMLIVDNVIIPLEPNAKIVPILEGLKPENIERVDVLKNKSAEALYGAKGKHGVFIIKSKNEKERLARVEKNSKNRQDFDSTVLYIIDGKKIGKSAFESVSLKNEDIESIDILKMSKAKELYGKEGENGVIIIKRKDEANLLYIEDGEITEVKSRKKLDEMLKKLKAEDIERLDILYDKGAKLVYGDKGTDGVYIITTKAQAAKELEALGK